MFGSDDKFCHTTDTQQIPAETVNKFQLRQFELGKKLLTMNVII